MQIYDMVSGRMFSQIRRIPDLIREFWAKKCGLYAGVYGISFDFANPIFGPSFY